MADIVGPLLEVVKCIANPTCNYVDRYKNFDEDVNRLRDKLEDINRRKRDLESTIAAEARAGGTVREEVRHWIQRVPSINNEVQAILQKAQGVKRYRKACLGKDVRRKFDEVNDIYNRGSFNGSLVLGRALDPEIIIPTENLVGEISTKDEIWKHLMDDKVGMIGVCGIGGVGKTTIMKHIRNDLLREGRFEIVIWVTVSYPLNVFDLQKKIADAMHETLQEDEEEMMRAAALMDIMGSKSSFVLILDDVWEKFSLKDVGIPEPVQNKSKVVITSRSIEVCNYLECKIVKVQPLSSQESLSLFLDKVGRDVLQNVSGLEETLKLIVEECKGLPLAIVVIAGSLKGEYDITEWRNALNELRQCVKSVNCVEDEIFGRLKFSYDRLKSLPIQECFLYCSFPEDYEFAREELIEDWIDEGLIVIDELGSRQAAYDRGHGFLNRLRKNCLLEECVGSDGVKMHDVVRDMAIKSIGPRCGYMVKAGMKLKKVPNESEWAGDLKKVSLMANDISKIPAGLSPKCALLSTLILSNNFKLLEISSLFFEDMAKLKVLDLSSTNVKDLPDSIFNLVNLSALRLRKCRNLEYLPSLARLGALKKLDLRRAKIEVVPEGMEMLISLEYLDLSETSIEALPSSISKLEHLSVLLLRRCRRLKCLPSLEKLVELKKLDLWEAGIEVVPQGMEMLVSLEHLDLCCEYLKKIPTGILSKLSSLQYLMAKGDWPISVKIKINLEEVARLRKLETFGFNFDDMQDFNYLLREFKIFKSFIAYELLVGNQSYSEDVNSNNNYKCKLIISECDIGEEFITLPDKLQHLRIHKCKNIRSSLNKTVLLENATELGFCIIEECEAIEYVVELDSSSSSSCSPAVLDKLEDLYLWYLPRLWALVRVGGVATSPRVFSNLKKLQIAGCSGMRTLLSLELLQALQNLEAIGVHFCKQMEEIIALSDSDASSSDNFTFTFPKLRELCLQDLPKLKSICSVKGVMVCDSIEYILIRECLKLKRIPIQLPLLDNGQPSPPPHLREICIHKWEKMAQEWWESMVEWDHPNAKNILQPLVK